MMDVTEEKRYNYLKQTTTTLFLVAYILSTAFRHEFLPIAFGYIALIPIVINLILIYKIVPLIKALTDNKLKRKRIAGLSIGLLFNLIIAAIIVTTLITLE